MNPLAILSLISDLYLQVQQLQTEVTKLKEGKE